MANDFMACMTQILRSIGAVDIKKPAMIQIPLNIGNRANFTMSMLRSCRGFGISSRDISILTL